MRGLEAELRAAGAVVDIERRVPELYQCRPDGSIREAVMDLVVGFPATAQRWWLDVNVRTPFCSSLPTASRIAGAAAAAGDRAKATRYGDAVRCVAVEAGGRLSAGAAAVIAELAAASQLHGRRAPGGRRGTTARALAERLSTIVVLWCADATLAALGH